MKIIQALISGEKSVNEISGAIDEEQSNVSHNLNSLESCHFIMKRVEGKKRIYSLNEETIAPILSLVEKHVKKYCQGGCCLK